MHKRQHQRLTKRLETIFSSGDMSFTGISSNLSEGGLFIRSRHGFVPGSIIDIELLLPEGKVSFLKGRVKRTLKTPLSGLKNGMGIELIKKDVAYINFLRSLSMS
ncbi:MAG: PilZ domain-containing protein [Nitrospirota bacterium]